MGGSPGGSHLFEQLLQTLVSVIALEAFRGEQGQGANEQAHEEPLPLRACGHTEVKRPLGFQE